MPCRTVIEMLEKTVERRLVQAVKAAGGVAYKFVSPGNAGVPDRLVVLPGGRVHFVELKTDSGRLSPIQCRQLDRLRAMGADIAVLYGKDDVDAWLREVLPDGQ